MKLFLLALVLTFNICFADKKLAVQIFSNNDEVIYQTTTPHKAVHQNLIRENIDTLEKVLTYAANKHGEKDCLGTRQILSEEDEIQNGQVSKKYSMGEYQWQSFFDIERTASEFGRGLRELGLEPLQNVAIFAETRAEWMVAAHGCFKQNFPIVTVYATFRDDGIVHVINETEASVVITSHELLPKLNKLLDQLPYVQTIVYMKDQLQETSTDGFKDGVRVLSFDEVVDKGKTSTVVASPPTPDDIAIIMYTSGSTGTPKGVLLSHKNCIATLKGFSDAVEVQSSDVLIGFLPLAHVYELLTENLALLTGAPIGYSSPNTLIDSSTKIKKGCKGDASVLKPTIMTSVPLILDRISKGIDEKVNSGSLIQKTLFRTAHGLKKRMTRAGLRTPILDNLVFKKIANVIGGRVRLILSGGAPLSAETHEKIKICMCADVIRGYGLTETTSGATVVDFNDLTFERVGAPITTTEIRLRSWERGGYRVTNKPFPQGEIIIGGDNVSPGYYKQPGKTAEEFFDEDGKRWFKTGDIGEFHADGVLKIIDRKKYLVKLRTNEYVSLGKIETALKSSAVIDEICAYAESSKDFVVALVVPNPKQLQKIAASEGLINAEFEDLCKSPLVIKAVLKEINQQARKANLKKFEVPRAVKLCKETWSPDSGLVTAVFKIKRTEIKNFYQNDIDEMYSRQN